MTRILPYRSDSNPVEHRLEMTCSDILKTDCAFPARCPDCDLPAYHKLPLPFGSTDARARQSSTNGTGTAIGAPEARAGSVASSMCLHPASKYRLHDTPLCSMRIVHGCARRSARVASLPLMFPARTWVPRISVPLALLHADRTATRNELVRGTQHQIGLDRKYAPRLVERVAPITGAWLAVPSRFDHPVRSLPRVPHR